MNYDETITTLQFASRAIKIKVNASVNEKIEMKKIKDKINDISKIKNIDSILKEKHKLEKDANDLKSSFNNFKNDLRKANVDGGRSKSANKDEEEDDRHYRSNSNMKSQYSVNAVDPVELQEYTAMTKKFHSIIIHLQTELAKSTVTINNLNEENIRLKETLSKYKG